MQYEILMVLNKTLIGTWVPNYLCKTNDGYKFGNLVWDCYYHNYTIRHAHKIM